MAKRKGRGPRKPRGPKGPYIKNSNLIDAGSKLKMVKDEAGNPQFAQAVRNQQGPPSNKVLLAKSAPTPVKETLQPKPVSPKVNALKSTTSLTPPAKAMNPLKTQKVLKGASKMIAEQKNVKPVVKPPAPVKKPPTPGR